MGFLRVFAVSLFVVCIPVGLLTTNIRLVVNEPRVYRYAIDHFDAERRTGLDRGQLLRAGAELRRYFNNDQQTVSIRVQQAGREQELFNARETAHLADVKDRFQVVNRLQEFSVLYSLGFVAIAVLWRREVRLRSLASYVATGSGICLIAVCLTGILALMGFESAWEDFHRLMFSNDFWQLDPATDRLIQMFPPAFWEDIVFFIGLATAAQAAMLLLASWFYLRVTRQAEPRRLLARYV